MILYQEKYISCVCFYSVHPMSTRVINRLSARWGWGCRSGAILFTIRTYIRPLTVFESRPLLAKQLVQAMEALPDSIIKYKTMAGFYDVALQYLQQCAAQNITWNRLSRLFVYIYTHTMKWCSLAYFQLFFKYKLWPKIEEATGEATQCSQLDIID